MSDPQPAPVERRILVTGSRDWTDRATIDSALWHAWADLGAHDARITLVHGDCPTGADQIAAEVWQRHSGGQPVEPHPADWSRGRKAGPERNAAMVALGADLCLAFIDRCTSPRCDRADVHPSHGATGCANLAEQAGIETRRFSPTPQEPR